MDIVKVFTANGVNNNINILNNNDNLLFRASDVGSILEIKNIRSAIQSFDKDEKVVVHKFFLI